ncbi:MAG: hypothetical protein R3C05_19000 [Pirellulaceae bacterium]
MKASWIDEPNEAADKKVRQIVAAVGDRLKVAGDIVDYEFCFVSADELSYVDKDFGKRIANAGGGAVDLLKEIAAEFSELGFSVEGTEAALKRFVDAKEIKIGQIIHAVRVATTGQAVGFGMFETLAILGRDEVVRRIEKAVNRVGSQSR